MKYRLERETGPCLPSLERAADVACRDGRIEIDVNNVENLIRQIALSHQDALLAGHDEGGRFRAHIASLIADSKIKSVEPFLFRKEH